LELAGAIFHLGDQGGYGHWKILPPAARALEERAGAIEKRAKIRHQLLNKMVAYAHLTTCRRKFLLDYFGDTTPPQSPRCCDNHTAERIEDLPKAVTAQEWFPLIVLETVRSLQQRPIGRSRLAQLLNGSQAQEMQQFGYDHHKFYGKLGGLSQRQVIELIDAMIEARYLRLTGGELPVLNLTPLGLQALEARAALPIRLASLATEAVPVERWQARTEKSDTVIQTFELFKRGLTPTQIAAERNLTEITVYNHLARLIADEKIELHQLIPPEIETQVLQAIATVGSAARLTPIKTALPEEITFDQIKCVIAAHPELPKESPLLESDSEPQPSISSAPLPPSTPAPPSSSPDIIILEAAAKLGGTLGRTGLAQFLTGSKASWLEPFAQHSYYGQLASLSQPAVMDIIDALITDGQLATTGGNRPKVVLKGQAESKAKAKAEEEADEALKQTMSEVSEENIAAAVASSETDLTLLEALRAWRTQEAKSQGMPPYIIFSNKVLEAIAARPPATLAELGEISGIGPAKLEQYGAAVIALIKENSASDKTQGMIRERPAAIKNDEGEDTQNPPLTEIFEEIPGSESTLENVSAGKIVNLKSKIVNPLDAILCVVSDLDGLLSPDGLASLLTAAPGEIVPFGDHTLRGVFQGSLTGEEMETHIQEAVQAKHVILTPRQRLILGEGAVNRQ
jgi:superfamily II DNA helicase RecQ